MIEIKPEAVCHIVFRARQMQAADDPLEVADEKEEQPLDLDDLDEEALERGIHDEHEHDPTYNELKEFIDGLSFDDQYELIALAWLGRDSAEDEWAELLRLARERRTQHTAEYLLSMPLLADYLQDALQVFDISCEDFEEERR